MKFPLHAQKSIDLIPAPKKLEIRDKWYTLPNDIKVAFAGEEPLIAFEALKRGFPGHTFVKSSLQDANIHLTTTKDPSSNPESYNLSITENWISIQANTGAGFFYGVQTLIQLHDLAELQGTQLRCLYIGDEPKFPWRGMHLDVCRHFFEVDFIKKYLDCMAYYKMNTFHWHLTEDQGWRIEIKKYPLLTQKGAWRDETLVGHWNDKPHKYDKTQHGGFYTQEQVKDIVEYARQRAITIVPEIEMPGHATAALFAYPEFSCENDKPTKVVTEWGVFNGVFAPSEATFQFLDDVLSEVAALFPGKYIHIGGDEAPKEPWLRSPIAQEVMKREGLKTPEELQSYFIRRIEKILAKKNKSLIGWDEILEGGLAPTATVMSWRGESGGIEAAKEHHDVIMTPGFALYFDHYQGNPSYEPLAIGGLTPLQEVYEYNPLPKALTPEEAKHILGAQANVWTEYLPESKNVEYMAFPRMLALSEVVWSPKESRKWADFQKRIYWHYSILEKKKINYRVPEPSGGGLYITSEREFYKTLEVPTNEAVVRYTLHSLKPDINSAIYKSPLGIKLWPEDTTILMATTFTTGGRQSAPAKFVYLTMKPLPTVKIPAGTPPLQLSAYTERLTSVSKLKDLSPRYVHKRWKEVNFPLSGTEDTTDAAQKAIYINEVFKQDPTAMGVPEGYLSLVFEGFFKVNKTGVYTFTLLSDDGSALYIQEHLIVNNDGPHAPTAKEGQIVLKKGIHPFRLEYFDAGGGAVLKIEVAGPGGKKVNLNQLLVD